MNRYDLLHSTRDVSVSRFDHPPHEVHCDPEEEQASRFAIAFVRRGSFEIALEGRSRSLTAGSVFLTRPGLEFRCRHTELCPTDVCITIRFDSDVAADAERAWARAGWVVRERATPRLAYVDRRMGNAADTGDGFEIERWALAALTALEGDTRQPTSRGHYAPSESVLDAVVAISRSIEAQATVRRSVAERARDVGLTSTQLTHAFRRYVGVSPHQYVVRWRLIAASELLSSGLSVSESCYRAGFENLSHFCRTFQRTFGTRASGWRALSHREARRKVQDLSNRRI